MLQDPTQGGVQLTGAPNPIRWLGTLLFAFILLTPHMALAEDGDAPAAEEESGPDIAFIAAISTMSLGAATLATGGVLHATSDDEGDKTVAYVTYAAGGFVALVGFYILAQSMGGHPGGAEPETAALLPWVGPDGAGIVLTTDW